MQRYSRKHRTVNLIQKRKEKRGNFAESEVFIKTLNLFILFAS